MTEPEKLDPLLVGVDLGKSGGLCLFNPAKRSILNIFNMPMTFASVGGNKRKVYDLGGLRILISTLVDIGAELFVIEAPGYRPGQGQRSGGAIGYGAGLIHMACHCHGVRFQEVQASVWKRKLKVPLDDYGILQRADQLFPNDYLRFRGKLGGAADGLAEAAMIALYGAEEILGIKR